MSRIPFRVGAIAFCASAALYRAVWLSWQLSGLDAFDLGYLLLADVQVLGVLMLLAVVESVAQRKWKPIPIALTVIVLLCYIADWATVLALNSRLQLADLRRFAAEWWLVPAFLNIWSVAALLLLVGSFFGIAAIPATAWRIVPSAALILVFLPFVVSPQSIPSHLHKYTGSVLLLGKELWGASRPPISRYRSSDFAVYRGDYDRLFDAPIADSGTSIILVIVESLSAVASQRTAGLDNELPRFDELSREGILFRNFFANFEASEGGIISLLSGVPPMHFPTASTNTFGEYAVQRSITDTFRRKGYRTEFVTTVPIQFISMDRYATSPFVGFSVAAGQKETPRFAAAPKFAFESPSDHVLYEEVLHRLDALPASHDHPVFIAAVTASSHHPYIDPAGKDNREANVWAFVQEQIWWLYQELTKRGFFENGVLIVTGDHRRMEPVRERERERFGDSAKARIPLLILGQGVPKGVLDDRLFQQADLLRMLDRALTPGASLSPFAMWVERYVFVYGVASNASNLQIFEATDMGRRGYRLNLRGAEIEWVDRPAAALSIERVIHRQRALQQATRMARVGESRLAFGRTLKPADPSRPGVLLGYSSDTDATRDPDQPHASLRMMTSESFDLETLRTLVGDTSAPFTMTVRAFLPLSAEGEYWFSVFSDDETCLAIDQQVVLGCQRGLNEGMALLQTGLHRFDFRYVHRRGKQPLKLSWLPPGTKQFTNFPQQALVRPATD